MLYVILVILRKGIILKWKEAIGLSFKGKKSTVDDNKRYFSPHKL